MAPCRGHQRPRKGSHVRMLGARALPFSLRLIAFLCGRRPSADGRLPGAAVRAQPDAISQGKGCRVERRAADVNALSGRLIVVSPRLNSKKSVNNRFIKKAPTLLCSIGRSNKKHGPSRLDVCLVPRRANGRRRRLKPRRPMCAAHANERRIRHFSTPSPLCSFAYRIKRLGAPSAAKSARERQF